MWEMGWSNGPIGLIARFSGSEVQALTDWFVQEGVVAVLYRNPFDESDWVSIAPGTLGIITPHFPYGYSVEPDSL